jgi:S1-C subfamily serine protease
MEWSRIASWGLALAVGGIAGAALHRASLPAPPPALATPAEVFAAVEGSVVSLRVRSPESRLGSGVAVSATEIATARHLVFDTVGPIEVTGANGPLGTAEVVGTDARTDLALLRLDGPLSAAVLGDSRELRVGDPVLAVGNPFGLGHSLSVGVVGGVRRQLDRDAGPRVAFLQLSIPLNPGNSGGPIFDLSGRVVGLLTGTHTQGQAIAFAVPAERVAESLPALRTGRQFSRAFLGVRVDDAGGSVRVTSVVPSSPADRAGIRPGDEISSFDEVTLGTSADFYGRLDALHGGARASLRLFRDGQLHVVPIELADWAEQPTVIAGLTLRPLPGSGGEVVAVRPDSRAARAGIEVDDVVRTVNGLPMQAPSDVKDALTGTTTAQLGILRGGAPLSLTL